jgi:hypothetical protein
MSPRSRPFPGPLFFAAVLALCSGCAGVNPIYPQHTLLFNLDGVPAAAGKDPGFVAAGGYDTASSAKVVEYNTLHAMGPDQYDAYLDRIFAGYDAWAKARGPQAKPPTLALCIRGGVQDYGATLREEAQLVQNKDLGKDDYLVEIHWSPGLGQSLIDHWFRVSNGARYNTDRDRYRAGPPSTWRNDPDSLILRPISQFVIPPIRILDDLRKGTLEFFDSLWDHFNAVGNSQQWWNDHFGEEAAANLRSALDDRAQGCLPAPPAPTGACPAPHQAARLLGGTGDDEGFLAQEFQWLAGVYTAPFIGAESVLLREGGIGAHAMMQRHADRLFVQGEADNAFHYYRLDLRGGAPQRTYYDLTGLGDGPMGVFVRRLGAFQRSHPGVKIDLYAHAMGAVVADEILRRAWAVQQDPLCPVSPQNPRTGLHFNRVAYLSPADTLKGWEDDVWPYLAANDGADGRPKTLFYNVMLNYLSEDRERHWFCFFPHASAAWAWIPFVGWSPIPIWEQGSPLVWIDNHIATNQNSLDRTLGRASNLAYYVDSIPAGLRDQVRLRSFRGGQDQVTWTDADGRTEAAAAPQTSEEAGEVPFWKDGFYAGLDGACLKPDSFY